MKTFFQASSLGQLYFYYTLMVFGVLVVITPLGLQTIV